MYTVYKHLFPNGKVYIGITKQTPKMRWRNGSSYKKQPIMCRAIKKYGWDNLTHKILAENLTQEEACKMEIELIAQYDSRNTEKGYNISIGGQSSFFGRHHSEETKKHFSIIRKGKNNPFYGKHHTKETKEKNRIAHSGTNAYFYGKKRGFMKMHEWHEKAVICLETKQIYASTVKAGQNLNIPHRQISRVCRGERPHTHKLHFRYLTVEEKEQWQKCMSTAD